MSREGVSPLLDDLGRTHLIEDLTMMDFYRGSLVAVEVKIDVLVEVKVASVTLDEQP